MKVNNTLILEIAKLAKLEFDKESLTEMKNDMQKIISFVEKLNEIDTKNVDPLIYISKEVNVLRKDEISTNLSQYDALKNAANKDSDYFKIRKILKK